MGEPTTMKFEHAFIPYGAYWSTPFCRWQGSFSSLHPLEFAAQIGRRALAERNLSPAQLDFLFLGTTIPSVESFYGAPWVAALMGAPGLTGPTIAQACATSARLLGTKDPSLPDTFYVTALAAKETVNTMPEKTLLAFAERGEVHGILGEDTSEADRIVREVCKAGVDVDELAAKLQAEGRDLFVESWNDLLLCIESKRNAMEAA